MRLKENIKKVKANIEAVNAGNDITVIAATKTVSAEIINLLPSSGINIAGENRVQELLEKYGKVKGVEWHFIGALQTNKVKYIIDKVTLIQSVDRKNLIDEIDKQAKKHSLVMPVLIEINVGGEETKSGVSENELGEIYSYASSKENIRVEGFMSVLPINAKDEHYQKMHEIFTLYKQKNQGIKTLSMGMSDDYEKAVKNGANMVRVGSVLFGERN